MYNTTHPPNVAITASTSAHSHPTQPIPSDPTHSTKFMIVFRIILKDKITPQTIQSIPHHIPSHLPTHHHRLIFQRIPHKLHDK